MTMFKKIVFIVAAFAAAPLAACCSSSTAVQVIEQLPQELLVATPALTRENYKKELQAMVNRYGAATARIKSFSDYQCIDAIEPFLNVFAQDKQTLEALEREHKREEEIANYADLVREERSSFAHQINCRIANLQLKKAQQILADYKKIKSCANSDWAKISEAEKKYSADTKILKDIIDCHTAYIKSRKIKDRKPFREFKEQIEKILAQVKLYFRNYLYGSMQINSKETSVFMQRYTLQAIDAMRKKWYQDPEIFKQTEDVRKVVEKFIAQKKTADEKYAQSIERSYKQYEERLSQGSKVTAKGWQGFEVGHKEELGWVDAFALSPERVAQVRTYMDSVAERMRKSAVQTPQLPGLSLGGGPSNPVQPEERKKEAEEALQLPGVVANANVSDTVAAIPQPAPKVEGKRNTLPRVVQQPANPGNAQAAPKRKRAQAGPKVRDAQRTLTVPGEIGTLERRRSSSGNSQGHAQPSPKAEGKRNTGRNLAATAPKVEGARARSPRNLKPIEHAKRAGRSPRGVANARAAVDAANA